ncbi:MAG TPA: helix-turn-helix transcriptional regulator [Trichocoleus sp.]|jgi:DNA-binding CsgD family transcriptional regulator
MYTQKRQSVNSNLLPQRHNAPASTPPVHYPEDTIILRGILESLDGILIVTDKGDILHSNRRADRLCRQLMPESTQPSVLPRQIWRSCQALIKNQDVPLEQQVVLDEEIRMNESIVIRVRIRWIDLNNGDRPCLLLMMEDKYESARYRAIAESWKYGLTDRETEVWQLKRIGCTYKQIAAQLHIAEDTVKKHIKNIYARRDAKECLSN